MSARRSNRSRLGVSRRQSTGTATTRVIPHSAPASPSGNHEPGQFPSDVTSSSASTSQLRSKNRRSSLNITTRLTPAEARALRRQREEEEKQRKEDELEEKRQAAKARRQALAQKRQDELAEDVTCEFCNRVMPGSEYGQHKVEHPSQIRPRLWLGKKKNVIDLPTMEWVGATHNLNCAREVQLPENVRSTLQGYHQLDLVDKSHASIVPFMRDALEFMDNSLSNPDAVLIVNCVQGISRSGSFTCAFLMWKEARSLHDAMAEIVSRRPIVLPNGSFLRQLQELDEAFRADRGRSPEEREYGTPLPYTLDRL